MVGHFTEPYSLDADGLVKRSLWASAWQGAALLQLEDRRSLQKSISQRPAGAPPATFWPGPVLKVWRDAPECDGGNPQAHVVTPIR